MLEFLVGTIIMVLFFMLTQVCVYLYDKLGKELIFMIGMFLVTAYIVGYITLNSII